MQYVIVEEETTDRWESQAVKQDLGKLLLENEQITSEQLKQAAQEATQTGEPVGTVLLRLGLVNEDILKTVLELQYAVNYLNLKKIDPDLKLVSLLPWEVVVENELVPISKEDNRLTLAMVHPSDSEALAKAKSVSVRLANTHSCLQ